MGREGTLATDYASGALSKDTPEEFDRLRLLEAWGDPDTHAVLRTVGLGRDWRCMEIGAGAGSVARWIADQCTEGSTLALDFDTRYLGDTDRANLEWHTGDIRAFEASPGSFDLVHSRLTFCHLPEREALVESAVRWLKPGGWLVIGDPMCMPAAASVHEPVRRFFGGLEKSWAAQGADMTVWAQTIPSQLARAGLGEIGVRTTANWLGDGGPYGALAAANIRQQGAYLAGAGLLTEEDVETMTALCAAPGFADLRSVMVYAWGRKPVQGGEGGS